MTEKKEKQNKCAQQTVADYPLNQGEAAQGSVICHRLPFVPLWKYSFLFSGRHYFKLGVWKQRSCWHWDHFNTTTSQLVNYRKWRQSRQSRDQTFLHPSFLSARRLLRPGTRVVSCVTTIIDILGSKVPQMTTRPKTSLDEVTHQSGRQVLTLTCRPTLTFFTLTCYPTTPWLGRVVGRVVGSMLEIRVAGNG